MYSYVVQRGKKFYKELEKIPDSEWFSSTSISRTISQDVLGQIEKTVASIGLS